MVHDFFTWQFESCYFYFDALVPRLNCKWLDVLTWFVMHTVQVLPLKPRPLYSMVMDKLILCFSGFKVKEQLVSFM